MWLGKVAVAILIGSTLVGCTRSEHSVDLTMEVAYPMIDPSMGGRVWAVARVGTPPDEFRVGDQVAAIVRCEDRDCRFAGLSKAAVTADLWIGGRVIRTSSPTEAVILPEPFPLPMEVADQVRGLEYEDGKTKLVRCTYQQQKSGRLDFVGLELSGTEARPAVTWK